MSTKKILVRAVFFIALATLGSRILGFLREVQLAYYFGLSPMRGAFTVAFKIPNLIRLLIADAAISAAFIPVLTGYLVKDNKEEAWRISSYILNMVFLVLAGIVLLCELFMPFIIRITTPGFVQDPELFAHTVQLSRVIFPIILILGVGGVIVGILHSLKHFTAPAVAPIFWNIVNLSAVFFFHQQWGIYAAAWGLLAATLLQLFVQSVPFATFSWKYQLKLGLAHPAMRQIGALIIPVSLSIGVINFNVLVDNFFASLLGPSEVAAIDSAFRLFHLPQGMFAIAIGTVLFPVMSGFAAKHNFKPFATSLQTGLRQIFYITLPFTGWFIALALPIARLCFERGSFTAADSQMVAWALLFYAVGMSFTSANTLLNRGFYSLKKMWVPLYVAVFNIILNGVLDWLLMKPFGHGGICLSTALVSTFNFFALSYLMKREVSEFKFSPIIKTTVKMAVVTVALGFTSKYIWQLLDIELGRSLFAQVGSIIGGLIAGGLLYIGVSYIFRFRELKEALVIFQQDKKVA